jgi:carbon monoxide dehydrogenase subunit G
MNGCWHLVPLLFVAVGMVWPSRTEAESAPAVEVRVVGDVYQVDGCFTVKAEPSAAWEVLTDYDRMGDFVRGVRQSTVESRHENSVRLEQQFETRLLVASINARVDLQVVETINHQIDFADLSHRDFEVYRGSFKLTSSREGWLTVSYQLLAKPRMNIPGWLSGNLLDTNVEQLLEDVRTEIERRATPTREPRP